MPRYQKYQDDDNDDDDDHQPARKGQKQADDDDDDDNDNSTRAQTQGGDDDDDNDDDNQGPQRGQQDDDDDNNQGTQGGQEDDDEDNGAEQQSQQNDGEDDDNQKPQQGQQDDDDERNDNDDPSTKKSQPRQVADADDEDDPSPPPSPPPEEDEDDDNEPNKSDATVNVNFNINLDLNNSDLHEGGTIFSKKLLSQLFSGPGNHDPHEKAIGVEDIKHEHVETHESGEWTVVELQTQDATGATIYLKAKLDSGADDNFMSFDIYKVTGLDFTPYEGPEGPPSFTTGSGEQTEPLGTVRLEYTAGIKPKKFIETFQVMEGLPHDVIIGKPLMTNAHMIMVDPNFAHPPEHKKLCLLELPPKDKGSKAKAIAFQKQRAAEQKAAYEAKIKAQEAAAPKSGRKGFFGRHH